MNKPAFPKELSGQEAFPAQCNLSSKGMTMRQWYKGMALKFANPFCNPHEYPDKVAKNAGKLADALLKEDEEYEKNKK